MDEEDPDLKSKMAQLDTQRLRIKNDETYDSSAGSHEKPSSQVSNTFIPKQCSVVLEQIDLNLVHGASSTAESTSNTNVSNDVMDVVLQIKKENIEDEDPFAAWEEGQQILPEIESSAPHEDSSKFSLERIKEEDVEETIMDIGPQNSTTTAPSVFLKGHVLFSLGNTNVKIEDEFTEENNIIQTIHRPIDFSTTCDMVKVEDLSTNIAQQNLTLEVPPAFLEDSDVLSLERINIKREDDVTEGNHIIQKIPRLIVSSPLQNSTPVSSSPQFSASPNEPNFSCKQCAAQFKTKDSLQTHIQILCNGKSISCEQCSKKFSRKPALKRHLLTHINEKLLSCTKCPAQFNRKDHFKRHLLTHSGKKPFSCDQCSARFKRKDELGTHLYSHSSKKPFPLEENSEIFTSSSNVKYHLPSRSNERCFSCEQCSGKFKTRALLKRHMLIHSNEKPFSCGVCSARFRRKDEVRIHLYFHSSEKRYSCELCPAKFTISSNLKSHLLIHSNEKPFSCDHCLLKFRTSLKLKYHSVTHSNERPFFCKQCPRRFKRKGDLRVHAISHSKEKPFSCNICSETFKSTSALKYHAFYHTNEKPFACSQCSLKFISNSNLKRHLSTHSDEKPFSCERCSTKFKNNDNLKKHLRSNATSGCSNRRGRRKKTTLQNRNEVVFDRDRLSTNQCLAQFDAISTPVECAPPHTFTACSVRVKNEPDSHDCVDENTVNNESPSETSSPAFFSSNECSTLSNGKTSSFEQRVTQFKEEDDAQIHAQLPLNESVSSYNSVRFKCEYYPQMHSCLVDIPDGRISLQQQSSELSERIPPRSDSDTFLFVGGSETVKNEVVSDFGHHFDYSISGKWTKA